MPEYPSIDEIRAYVESQRDAFASGGELARRNSKTGERFDHYVDAFERVLVKMTPSPAAVTRSFIAQHFETLDNNEKLVWHSQWRDEFNDAMHADLESKGYRIVHESEA